MATLADHGRDLARASQQPGPRQELAGSVAAAMLGSGEFLMTIFDILEAADTYAHAAGLTDQQVIDHPDFEQAITRMMRANSHEFERWAAMQNRLSGGRWPR